MDRVREVRPPLYNILKTGLEETISWAQGETELRVTTVTIPEPPPPYDAIRVAALRQRLRLSQAGFAQLLNVSPKTVQSWEQGARTPSHAAARFSSSSRIPRFLHLEIKPWYGGYNADVNTSLVVIPVRGLPDTGDEMRHADQ